MGSNPTLSATLLARARRPGAVRQENRIPPPSLRVLPDLEALSRAAAAEFTRAVAAAARRRGGGRVALAGGATPRRLYEMLADPALPWRGRIPWGSLHVFFGDERLVPPDHPDSNYRTAREALLSRVPIPARQVHRIRGETSDPARAARAYERVLRAAFGARGRAVPRFDLILLGMGADGHVASLFPGEPALLERRRLAAPARSPDGRPRVTLTLPVLEAAARILVLVSGGAKAGTALRVLGPARADGAPGREGLEDLPPAARFRPRRGRITWFLDRAAARLLPSPRELC